MNMEKKSLNLIIITFLIAGLAISRLLPHPYNFSPVAALALFGGARFGNRPMAWLIPLLALWVSDLFLNFNYFGYFVPFYKGAFYTYFSFALIVFLGSRVLNRLTVKKLFITSISASLMFFILSNFGVWASGILYPMNGSGLAASYIAAIPFFRLTLAGDLIYSFAVFYGYALIQNHIPALRTID